MQESRETPRGVMHRRLNPTLSMARTNGTRATRLLHISRDQLRYRMEKFEML